MCIHTFVRIMASRKRTATTTLTVKQRKQLGDNLACVDCEDVASEAIDKVVTSLQPFVFFVSHNISSLLGQMMSNTLE